MSVLEKRLQVLIDEERFARLEAESQATGRSIGSIVRDAIDVRLAESNDRVRRRAAGARLLAATAEASGREPDWADTKVELEEALGRRLEHIP